MLPALAFCNDIDFAAWPTYREVHHVLWEEFGIQAEDSFWLFDPAGSEMALFKGSLDEKGSRHDQLLEEIAQGRLAVLHGAGNFSCSNTTIGPSRSLIGEGLAYLREQAKIPAIWTNHGDEGDLSNIGGGAPTYQQGDDPSSATYILDLLLQAGVRFFWADHHVSNTFTFSTNGTDGQRLLVKERTRAGYEITCFFRYRGALPKAPDAQTLSLQLTRKNLDHLVERGGSTVVYQHWCVHRDADGQPRTASSPVFPSESTAALKRLVGYRDRQLIRVMPLTELLDECRSMAGGPGDGH